MGGLLSDRKNFTINKQHHYSLENDSIHCAYSAMVIEAQAESWESIIRSDCYLQPTIKQMSDSTFQILIWFYFYRGFYEILLWLWNCSRFPWRGSPLICITITINCYVLENIINWRNSLRILLNRREFLDVVFKLYWNVETNVGFKNTQLQDYGFVLEFGEKL